MNNPKYDDITEYIDKFPDREEFLSRRQLRDHYRNIGFFKGKIDYGAVEEQAELDYIGKCARGTHGRRDANGVTQEQGSLLLYDPDSGEQIRCDKPLRNCNPRQFEQLTDACQETIQHYIKKRNRLCAVAGEIHGEEVENRLRQKYMDFEEPPA